MGYPITKNEDGDFHLSTNIYFTNGSMLPVNEAGATIAHNRIVRNLLSEIHSYLKGCTCEVYPSDLYTGYTDENNADKYLFPDVVIVCGEIEVRDDRENVVTNPTVVIEVLSPGTAVNDRNNKLEIYRSIDSLKEYILIDSQQCLVETLICNKQNHVLPPQINNIEDNLTIRALNLKIPLSDVYYNVVFNI